MLYSDIDELVRKIRRFVLLYKTGEDNLANGLIIGVYKNAPIS